MTTRNHQQRRKISNIEAAGEGKAGILVTFRTPRSPRHAQVFVPARDDIDWEDKTSRDEAIADLPRLLGDAYDELAASGTNPHA